MTTILLVGDIHLSDTPPSSRNDDYNDELFDLLQQTVTTAEDHPVNAVVWAGDVFHHKRPIRTSHRTLQRLCDIVNDYPVPLYIVPGNHDMHGNRFDSIFETQPLGVLFKAGANLLHGWSENLPIYGVPWLAEFTDMNVKQALEGYAVSEPALVVAHAPLYPPGKELPYEFYPAASWASAMGWRGSCYYGHVHEPHGTYVVAGVTFANAGSLSRGSLHEYNLERSINVTLWEDGSFTFVPLRHRPASEIFKIAEATEKESKQVFLDEFLAQIGTASIEITSIESVLDHVRTLDLAPSVVSLIKELLEA